MKKFYFSAIAADIVSKMPWFVALILLVCMFLPFWYLDKIPYVVFSIPLMADLLLIGVTVQKDEEIKKK